MKSDISQYSYSRKVFQKNPKFCSAFFHPFRSQFLFPQDEDSRIILFVFSDAG